MVEQNIDNIHNVYVYVYIFVYIDSIIVVFINLMFQSVLSFFVHRVYNIYYNKVIVIHVRSYCYFTIF